MCDTNPTKICESIVNIKWIIEDKIDKMSGEL